MGIVRGHSGDRKATKRYAQNQTPSWPISATKSLFFASSPNLATSAMRAPMNAASPLGDWEGERSEYRYRVRITDKRHLLGRLLRLVDAVDRLAVVRRREARLHEGGDRGEHGFDRGDASVSLEYLGKVRERGLVRDSARDSRGGVLRVVLVVLWAIGVSIMLPND